MNESHLAIDIFRRYQIRIVASGFVANERLIGMVVLVVQKRHPIIQQRRLKWLAIQSVNRIAWLETSTPNRAEAYDIAVDYR